jgi:hypothetical protein
MAWDPTDSFVNVIENDAIENAAPVGSFRERIS